MIRQTCAARLIDAWDAALAQHPVDRALTIAGCYTDLDRARIAAMSIGERDALLLEIRRRIVGDRLCGICACESCGERNEFDLDVAALPRPSPRADGVLTVTVGGKSVRTRLPNSFDLAAAADEPDEDEAARIIVRRCLLDEEALEPDVIAAVDHAMEGAEGIAALDLAFRCSDCGAANHAPLDIAAFLWAELSERVQRLVDDVETLAHAYGWSEADILGMSDRRRALYVERVRR